MEKYCINAGLTPFEEVTRPDACVLILLTSEELEQGISVPGLKKVIHCAPAAKDAHLCKADSRRDCLCGTITTPRHTRDGSPIAFGYLLTADHILLCDDSGAAHAILQHLRQNEPRREESSVGSFFYNFLELLIAKDLRHLQHLEEQMEEMEDQMLAGQAEKFTAKITALRKEISGWIRYYAQMDDLICEFLENENGYFSDSELKMLRMAEKRIERLGGEAQSLREYSLQLRELFQAEMDVRQNHIMKVLTIVTTIFLPLTLIVGWYGMNFAHMPELQWKYGYPAVIMICAVLVLLCLWIIKKKKFW